MSPRATVYVAFVVISGTTLSMEIYFEATTTTATTLY